MCGIAGWVSYNGNLKAHQDVITTMTKTMARRGPDAGGVWIDRHVGLGHRRLAIIDLAGGVQPMQAEDEGRTTVVARSATRRCKPVCAINRRSIGVMPTPQSNRGSMQDPGKRMQDGCFEFASFKQSAKPMTCILVSLTRPEFRLVQRAGRIAGPMWGGRRWIPRRTGRRTRRQSAPQ
jgi:hypothetical protein